MNIFVLSRDTKKCAQYHCDKHVVKMIIEYTQILSTTQHFFGVPGPMKITHINHPCTVRVRESYANYVRLSDLALALSEEYTMRYGKIHSLHDTIVRLRDNPPQGMNQKKGITTFFQAMPDEYRNKNVITAYRTYYNKDKSRFAKRKNVSTPSWFKKEFIELDTIK